MTVLLTLVAWAAISFLFSCLWGNAISSGGDHPDESFPLTPGQPAA